MSQSASQDVFLRELKEQLPSALPGFLIKQRWFGGKSRTIRGVRVLDVVPLTSETLASYVALVRVDYASGPAEIYSLPLAASLPGTSAADAPSLVIPGNDNPVELHDALWDESFQQTLLSIVRRADRWLSEAGELRATSTGALPSLAGPVDQKLPSSLIRAEQSNTSITYGGRLIFKWFRRLETGINPDVEIGTFLTEGTPFRNVPQVAGYINYLGRDGAQATLGLLQAYVANQGDAWRFTLKSLAEYYLRAANTAPPEPPQLPLLALAEGDLPAEARNGIGTFLDSAALLGLRTAELHLALSSGTDAAFSSEPFDQAGRREIAESANGLIERIFPLLRERRDSLGKSSRVQVAEVLAAESRLRRFFADLENLDTSAVRTRIHGDYHLGQVLYTGEDFMIIDFEGEPARSLEERRRKRSPLQDVAGMLRSFDYAAYAPLLTNAGSSSPHSNPEPELQRMAPWAAYWKTWVSASFLKSYLVKAEKAPFIPNRREVLQKLLDAYVLDKALYELGYELNNRPDWLAIPLNGIATLLETGD